MSSLKNEGSSIENIEDAIDFVNNKLLADDSSVPAIRSPVPASSVQDSLASQDQLSSCVANPGAINHAPDAKWNNLSNENEVQIPSELISHCVATLLMIQVSTKTCNILCFFRSKYFVISIDCCEQSLIVLSKQIAEMYRTTISTESCCPGTGFCRYKFEAVLFR